MSSDSERRRREASRIRQSMETHRRHKIERERIAYELARDVKTNSEIVISKVCECGREKCLLTSKVCCYCSDSRPVHTNVASYIQYVDGIGWVYDATREQFYCPTCKFVASRQTVHEEHPFATADLTIDEAPSYVAIDIDKEGTDEINHVVIDIKE